MRFSTALTFLASGLAMASPSPKVATSVVPRENLMTSSQAASAIEFAAQASCNLISCAKVVGDAICIGTGIAEGQVEAVLGCVSNGASGICPCAACVPGLDNFLSSHGVCK